MHQCHIPANQRSLQGRKNWNRFYSRTLGWEKHVRPYHRSVWHNAVCMDRNVVVFRGISLHHYISWCHCYRPTPLDTVPAIALVNAMLNSLVLRFQFSLLRTGSQKKRKGKVVPGCHGLYIRNYITIIYNYIYIIIYNYIYVYMYSAIFRCSTFLSSVGLL